MDEWRINRARKERSKSMSEEAEAQLEDPGIWKMAKKCLAQAGRSIHPTGVTSDSSLRGMLHHLLQTKASQARRDGFIHVRKSEAQLTYLETIVSWNEKPCYLKSNLPARTRIKRKEPYI